MKQTFHHLCYDNRVLFSQDEGQANPDNLQQAQEEPQQQQADQPPAEPPAAEPGPAVHEDMAVEDIEEGEEAGADDELANGGLGAAHQAMLQGGGPTGFQPYKCPNMFGMRVSVGL